MKTALNIPKALITHIDIMNTLNGGTSEPQVRLKQLESHREISVRVPGIQREQVKIEINNNKLTVFYFTIINTQNLEFPVPKILYDKVIPYFVDIHKITVREENGFFVVHMPFNELANGYRRDLSA